jgi:hypothetical protein
VQHHLREARGVSEDSEASEFIDYDWSSVQESDMYLNQVMQ